MRHSTFGICRATHQFLFPHRQEEHSRQRAQSDHALHGQPCERQPTGTYELIAAPHFLSMLKPIVLQSELVRQLYKQELLDNLLEESEQAAHMRATTSEMLKVRFSDFEKYLLYIF